MVGHLASFVRLRQLREGELLHEFGDELLDAFEGTDVVAQHSDSLIHVGTPLDLAELAEAWFEAGAVDGLVVTPSSLVADVAGLVDGVVPALRASGVFRREYPGATLRESLALTPSGVGVLAGV